MRKLIFIVVASMILTTVIAGCSNNGGNVSKENGNENTKKGNEPSPKVVTWIANSVWAEDNFISQGMKDFSAKVKEATNGQVIIDVKTGGALGYLGPELLKAVRDDLIPVSDYVLNGVAGDEPLFGVSSLPFLKRNFEEFKLFETEIARPYYDKVAEEKWNQKILYTAP